MLKIVSEINTTTTTTTTTRCFIVSYKLNQVIIAQWLSRWLATVEVLGSNPVKGDNY